MSDEPQLTPMMAQYRRIKGELPKDALLMFRLGDFYEMFFEDAVTGARLLNVTLTKRGVIPMCGIPFHALNGYIARLLRAGRKVAICDQIEEARPGQLVKREVTQILSPGTHFDERMLTAERNNFLAAICVAGKTFGLALVDLTTGDFKATEVEGEGPLLTELERLRPAEIIYPAEAAKLREALQGAFPILNGYDDWVFAPETAHFTLKEHFKVASLDGFGLKNRLAAIGAAGAVLQYLSQHLRRDVTHLTRLATYERRDYLILDTTALRNLEILEPLHRDAPRNATLYGALNRTVTPMGARRLRDWLTQPLAEVAPIQRRQDAVETWLGNASALEGFRAGLVEVRDLERMLARLSVGTGNARDLLALRLALEQVPGLKRTLEGLAAARNQAARQGEGNILHENGSTDFSANPPAGEGSFGPIFPQFHGRPAEAIAWLLKVRRGEVPGALSHPEVGEIDLVWGEATERGSGYGLAKIERWHPEMLAALPARLAAMHKLRGNERTIILGGDDSEAVVKLEAFGSPKRWLLTAYEKVKPASAGRTIDVPNQSGVPRQTPTPGGEPDGTIGVVRETVNAVDVGGRANAATTPVPQASSPASSGGVSPPGPTAGARTPRQLAAEDGCGTPAGAVRETVNAPAVGMGVDSRLPLLLELLAQLTELPELTDLLARAIVAEPPLAVKEGGLIREGFDAALDELKHAQRDGKDWIAKLQQDEINRTGIASLKVRFNSVFGYYIEVTRANLDKVPPHYIRKQTIANGERFITPELKEMEGKILGSEERSVKVEYEIFLRLREAVIARLGDIQRTADALAQLDVLGAFATTARLFGHVRPHVGAEGILHIRDGRHPVLDQSGSGERFVPNDTELDATTQLALITGPNMAGKSTYIRQVALLALLAHTGAFVPAAEARIDLVDRIFTRIGASDDLARGQSTFMVEMSETANILNNATARSLIILDEIGRGTSTFDGLSLAWSIVEHLHNQVGAKTLFATHYHELTELSGRLPRVKNYNVAVREWNDQIIFLRKIVAGGTDKSYGIHVARLAGVPKTVLERAKEILGNLEQSELTPEGNVRAPARHRAEREKLRSLAPVAQMDLFGR